MHMRVTALACLAAAVALGAGCISNMHDLKEKLGYASPPPDYAPPLARAQVNATTSIVGAPLRFTSDGTRDPQGLPLEYSWTFGDGGVALSATATHAYERPGEYVAHLIVLNSAGLSDTGTITVQVSDAKRPPTAAFTVAPAGGARVGDKLAFDPSASSSSDGAPLTYAWDFGDGATSLDVKPTHAYAQPGLYAATLRVTDGSGLSSDATQTLAVSGPLLHANGHVDATSSPSVAHAFTESSGARSIDAALAFDGGAASGVNALTLVVKDAAGHELGRATTPQPTPPAPMPGTITLKVSLDAAALASAAPGAWSAVVLYDSGPAGVDYALDVAATY
jgi:PKD repeat protein